MNTAESTIFPLHRNVLNVGESFFPSRLFELLALRLEASKEKERKKKKIGPLPSSYRTVQITQKYRECYA